MSAMNTLTLGADRALYVGELPATGWHRHAAPVLLLGLSGRFAVHLAPGRVETCHSALIDAGVWHLFDPCGERVALVYLEPDCTEARSLRHKLESFNVKPVWFSILPCGPVRAVPWKPACAASTCRPCCIGAWTLRPNSMRA